jgi:predicted P-loop ATPase
LLGVPPWIDGTTEFESRPWTDRDDIAAACWLQTTETINVTPFMAAQGIELVGRDHSYHPVRDYLDKLDFDGKARLETMFSDYFGTEQNAYTAAVGRGFMIGAVARIFDPGCKVDTMPILESPQGCLKSTATRTLFDPWFTDEINDLGSKDSAMQVNGTWCVEISELDAMARSDVSKIKAFVSRQSDRFRPPYGRRVIECPRSCIFIGTTNAEGYLKDETGNRRYLPIKVGVTRMIDVEGLARDRDQLWAEAVVLYRAGTKWWLVNASDQPEDDVVGAAQEMQEERYVGDPWDAAVSEYLLRLRHDGRIGGYQVGLTAILGDCLGLEKADWSQLHMNRVARILKRLGWTRHQLRDGDQRRWVYRKMALKPENEWLPDNVTTLSPHRSDEVVTPKTSTP